jgi:hypothetical protein
MLTYIRFDHVMKWKSRIILIAMPLVSIALALAVAELGLRLYEGLKPKKIALMKAVNEPYIFGLNPKHPDVNNCGLRNAEITVAKPKGVFRILVLGDSIAFGVGVKRRQAFPHVLETLLRKTHPGAQVLNASVPGHTTYNELQYYLVKGRAFSPNVVLVAFCLNDVVNPRLHWAFARDLIGDIPEEAIPNKRYDENHAVFALGPLLQSQMKQKRSDSFLASSLLYRKARLGVRRLFAGPEKRKPPCSAMFSGRLPTLLTTEDAIEIDVLMSDSSPERRWLASMFLRLKKAVDDDGGSLIVVLFPLAYQLDESYPFTPQKSIAAELARKGIRCIDLLPTFRKWGKADIFRLNNADYCDVWHPTPFGHKVTAEALAAYLTRNGLIGK